MSGTWLKPVAGSAHASGLVESVTVAGVESFYRVLEGDYQARATHLEGSR